MKKFKSITTIFAVLMALVSAPIAAQAAAGVDSTQLDLHLTPGVTPPTTFRSLDTGETCFTFTGGATKSLYFQSVTLNYTVGGQPYSEPLYATVQRSNSVFDLCFVPEVNTDFINATDVSFSGTLHQASTLSSNFETYLAGKMLTLQDTYIWFDGTKSRFEVTVKNNTNKALAYKVTDFQIDSKPVQNAVQAIVVPGNSETWIQLGDVAGDYEKDATNLPVSINMTTASFSKLTTSKVKVQKGLTIQPNSSTSWNFPTYNPLQPGESITRPCLMVKNTSGKALAIKATLSWKVDINSTVGNYGEVMPLAKGASVCVAGLDSNDRFLSGDVRLGKKATVSGSIVIVKESKIVTSGITLGGYTLLQRPWVSYDAATKSTQIVIYVTHPSFGGNALLSAPKVNGVQTDAAVVAGTCECGGPGIDYRSRTLVLSKVKGDLRVGKTLKITGLLQTSIPTTVSWTGNYPQSDDGEYGCTLYHPESSSTYNGSTNITDFKLQCYNNSTVAHSVDLSGLTAVAEEAGQTTRTYTPVAGASNIQLPAKMQWSPVTIFQLLGEWRTGEKSLTISGDSIVR